MSVGSWTRCRETTHATNHTLVITAYVSPPLRLTNMSWLPERQRRRSDIAVLICGVYHSTVGARVLVEFTLSKGIFYALDILVNGVLSAGHIDIINMLGRGQ
eukprot:4514100-Pyramimonas_sp.AAC.1